MDGQAILSKRALVVSNFGVEFGDAGMQNGIFREVAGKNDELRFGLSGLSSLEVKVDEFEERFAAMISGIFRPGAENGAVEVALGISNLPAAGSEARQVKINDSIVRIELP